ncbi:MAG TPA: hypothetical protein DIW43_12955 [Spongiibacteraceae bacterium]|nr:hypothetical protein [Spongiibacteraceae bacterium]HCS28360.1 hypothetical protein [Spongiibacteraceae bacterium]|tara:strand:- start:198 stop:494 length:297 start_codon:yes stop_codon:yes gene_type:complete
MPNTARTDAVGIASQALTDYFSAFAGGMDVPPARRYFIEGYLQALLDAGQMSFVDAQTLVVEACSAILGDEAAAQYKRQQDRIMLHSHTPRAPVYPGG